MLVKSLSSTAFAVLVLVSCVSSDARGPDVPTDQQSLTSWQAYGTLPELIRNSDLIIRGAVVAKVREHVVQPGRVPVAATEFTVRTERTLKGKALVQVNVVQAGRSGDPANTYPEFPLLTPGRLVVLFLKDATTEPPYADGSTKFAILGPEALYTISGGVLRTPYDSPLARSLKGMSLAQLEELVPRGGTP